MTGHVKDNGTWRTLVDGSAVKDNGVWRTFVGGWVKDNGVWRKWFDSTASSGTVSVVTSPSNYLANPIEQFGNLSVGFYSDVSLPSGAGTPTYSWAKTVTTGGAAAVNIISGASTSSILAEFVDPGLGGGTIEGKFTLTVTVDGEDYTGESTFLVIFGEVS